MGPHKKRKSFSTFFFFDNRISFRLSVVTTFKKMKGQLRAEMCTICNPKVKSSILLAHCFGQKNYFTKKIIIEYFIFVMSSNISANMAHFVDMDYRNIDRVRLKHPHKKLQANPLLYVFIIIPLKTSK